jgi:putative restriction endonuclease
VLRDRAFVVEIKKLYDYRCVICGSRRFTAAGYPEVESAHIYPKGKNGSDDLRNGIALCRLHHWAFDGGLFALTDELRVTVSAKIANDIVYKEINNFAGVKIKSPSDNRFQPDILFVSAHRKLHGF